MNTKGHSYFEIVFLLWLIVLTPGSPCQIVSLFFQTLVMNVHLHVKCSINAKAVPRIGAEFLGLAKTRPFIHLTLMIWTCFSHLIATHP